MTPRRAILIGGTSHAGKSTLAAHIALEPGWIHVSTDSLGRHPGRPWRESGEVPPHVVEHFSTLEVDALIASVLTHYQNMRPTIEALVQKHREASEPRLVLEGSGLIPETLAASRADDVSIQWLTASDTLLRTRMHNESCYDRRDAAGRVLIDKFLARAIAFNKVMLEDVLRLAIPIVEANEHSTVEELTERCFTQR